MIRNMEYDIWLVNGVKYGYVPVDRTPEYVPRRCLLRESAWFPTSWDNRTFVRAEGAHGAKQAS